LLDVRRKRKYDGGYITSPTTYDESTMVVKKRSQEATSCATLGTP